MLKRIFVGTVFGAKMMAVTFEADAFTWYPPDCIVIDHCAAVEGVDWVFPSGNGNPQLVVVTKYKAATVQRTFVVGESGDQHMHVCMRFDPFGTLEVTCLLVPGNRNVVPAQLTSLPPPNPVSLPPRP
jgi:hypothetical protein